MFSMDLSKSSCGEERTSRCFRASSGWRSSIPPSGLPSGTLLRSQSFPLCGEVAESR